MTIARRRSSAARRALAPFAPARPEKRAVSDTPASLRHKIEGAGDLQSVVRTMKALAASSIGQYEKSVRALSDYGRSVELGLGACLRDDGPPLRSRRRARAAQRT